MFVLECIAGPGSDCTALYDVRLDKEYMVLEFIKTVLENEPNEWGYIGIANGSIFGCPKCEYFKGDIAIGEEMDPVMDLKVEKATASGGWSRMDYLLKVEREEK